MLPKWIRRRLDARSILSAVQRIFPGANRPRKPCPPLQLSPGRQQGKSPDVNTFPLDAMVAIPPSAFLRQNQNIQPVTKIKWLSFLAMRGKKKMNPQA